MSVSADPLQFLDHEPPTGCCFQRNFEVAAVKPGQEPADSGAISRRDPAVEISPVTVSIHSAEICARC
jgi:hypothetical protein